MSGNCCVLPQIASPASLPVYRLRPQGSNRFAVLFDPEQAGVSLVACFEIFDPGGSTPPNLHGRAIEFFYVIAGEGEAYCDGKRTAIAAGDMLLIPATGLHEIRNTHQDQRLYVLTLMIPNEAFIELIRSGIPDRLDAADLAVLQQLRTIPQVPASARVAAAIA
ncbi:cupin domain-containing protein [Synechococcus elongatus]|uniref:cupin domain-containing protein n=1 Tax=Synechococcus elongatus TaxID=32046 RepID=UPI000F7F3EED|nr:cupin domain-containing protein [Synechococcus elongatus]